MSAASPKWEDLLPRVLSAAVLVAVGAAEIWIGGLTFRIFIWFLAGVMVWEAARMFGANQGQAVQLALLGAVALAIASYLPLMLVLPILVAAALAGGSQIRAQKELYVPFAAWALVAAYSVLMIREEAGFVWMVWLVAVVVASDIAGYFAGKLLGGPKFWPRISPKKTWSGTVAGWVAAFAVGLCFANSTGAGVALGPVSATVAFAGQLGDILESAMKRRTGVKDSSALIPGHGGVLDRFDAALGAAMLVVVLWFLNLVPGLS